MNYGSGEINPNPERKEGSIEIEIDHFINLIGSHELDINSLVEEWIDQHASKQSELLGNVKGDEVNTTLLKVYPNLTKIFTDFEAFLIDFLTAIKKKVIEFRSKKNENTQESSMEEAQYTQYMFTALQNDTEFITELLNVFINHLHTQENINDSNIEISRKVRVFLDSANHDYNIDSAQPNHMDLSYDL
ncbi:MAG: hypothetical protein KatS3mg085_193 [Candidatus Dojkabacteria bacterium]|nr:MAG: hypothetical protein KatS3mg085_193 [Candidatus Dojkabacteria bacterium]